jgi:hypothetical protein
MATAAMKGSHDDRVMALSLANSGTSSIRIWKSRGFRGGTPLSVDM